MLRTAPRRRKSTAYIRSTTSDHSSHARLSGAPHKPHAFAGAIGEAYGRFFELPVPIVLAALWLLGTILLVGLVLGVVALASMALV